MDIWYIDTIAMWILKAASSWTIIGRLVIRAHWLLIRVWKMCASESFDTACKEYGSLKVCHKIKLNQAI